MRFRITLTIALLLGVAAAAATHADAQEKLGVNRVRIVTPFPAGGAADMIAREYAHHLGLKLGVTTIVENRTGAGGIIGSENVAHSPPDGSTLLVTATHHAINVSLQKTLPYDTKKDFTNIALAAVSNNAIAINPQLPIKTLQELIDYAKANPGKITYGSTGVGGANHLAGEMFRAMAKIDIMHVPYPGSPQAMTAVLGGHISMIVNSLPTVLPYMPNNQLRVLAVTSKERSPSMPDVPTVDEAGVKGFEAIAWFGVYGPANMKPETYALLSKTSKEVFAQPALKESFGKMGIEPGQMAGDEFKTFVFSEIDKWSKVVEMAGLKPQ